MVLDTSIQLDATTRQLGELIAQHLLAKQHHSLVAVLDQAEATDIATFIRTATVQVRVEFWLAITHESPMLSATLLEHLSEIERAELVVALDTDLAKRFLPYIGSVERRQLLSQLPTKLRTKLLTVIPDSLQDQESAALRFDGNTVGAITKTEIINLAAYTTVSDLEELLGDSEAYQEHLEWRYAYLHNEAGQYIGALKTRDIFGLGSDELLIDHIDDSIVVIAPESDFTALKHELDNSAHAILPIVTGNGVQLGIVGARQLNEALYRQSEQQLLGSSGILGGDESRAMGLFNRNIRRLMFLLPSVVLSYAAVSIIAAFEPVIEQLALLAALLPLVANLSGAAGNQAVAVSIRELSTGHIAPRDLLYVVSKELPIGLINGVVIGAVIGVLAWFSGNGEALGLAWLVALAYTISSTLAVAIGGALPLMLKRLHVDPAMLSSPILTTLTDAISFFTVLYLVQLLLL